MNRVSNLVNHEKFKKMITYFNRKDLVSFGNYILSQERRESIEAAWKEKLKQGLEPLSLEETLQEVYHADVENWKESLK